MYKSKAEEYFTTVKAYNCAQAVLKAFEDRLKVDDELIANFKKCGGGKAENGLCGALFAAIHLAGDKKNLVKKEFEESVGHVKCRAIKKAGISCKICVCKAAEILGDVLDRE